MHALETIRNKDLEKVLNDCQVRQYPFTFWDEREIKNFDLGLLPTLTKIQVGWKIQDTFTLDLDDPEHVTLARKTLDDWVTQYENKASIDTTRSKEWRVENFEVGFGIVKRTGNIVVVVIYTTD